MTDKPLTMTCSLSNTVSEKGLPVSFHNLKQTAAFYKMSTSEKRLAALRAIHKTCRGLCGCSCHVTLEPPK